MCMCVCVCVCLCVCVCVCVCMCVCVCESVCVCERDPPSRHYNQGRPTDLTPVIFPRNSPFLLILPLSTIFSLPLLFCLYTSFSVCEYLLPICFRHCISPSSVCVRACVCEWSTSVKSPHDIYPGSQKETQTGSDLISADEPVKCPVKDEKHVYCISPQ